MELILSKLLSFVNGISINAEAKEFLFDYANGDARRMINLLEVISFSNKESELLINEDFIKKIA